MKKTICALIFATAIGGSAATAGSLSDPVVTPEVVAEEAVQSSENVEGMIAAVAVLLIIAGVGIGG